LVLIAVIYSTAVSGALKDTIVSTIGTIICSFYTIFMYIAVGIAALVMVLAGIKWIASENDPGARKAAKDAILHAIVGLIIIMIISAVLGMFVGTTPDKLGGMCGITGT
jgi:ABC-type phosphate transport system permease subunit